MSTLLLVLRSNRALVAATPRPEREVREESLDTVRHDTHEQHPDRRQRNTDVNCQRLQIRPNHTRTIIPARIERRLEIRVRLEAQRSSDASKRADAEQAADGEFVEAVHVEAADKHDGEHEQHDVLHDGAHADGEADSRHVEAFALNVAVPEGRDRVAGEDQHEAENERVGGDEGEDRVGDAAEARRGEDLDVEEDDGGFEDTEDGYVDDGGDEDWVDEWVRLVCRGMDIDLQRRRIWASLPSSRSHKCRPRPISITVLDQCNVRALVLFFVLLKVQPIGTAFIRKAMNRTKSSIESLFATHFPVMRSPTDKAIKTYAASKAQNISRWFDSRGRWHRSAWTRDVF